MDEEFGPSRFDGGPPGCGPGGSIDARDRFFGAWLLDIAHSTTLFGTRNWGFGFGLMRFELAALLALCFILACLFFLISISS